jgi:tRNA 2-thiocytidine biosynthesis protein TtcA
MNNLASIPVTLEVESPSQNSRLKTTKEQSYNHAKLQKRIRRNVGKAIQDYNMIEAGDRVMVCLSGGKDSYTMLHILMNLQRSAPIPFELIAVNLDQKQPGYPEHILPEYLATLDIEHHIIEQDTYSVVVDKIPEGKTMCSLCSRLRRGSLYTFAAANNIDKIALGHHRDDIIETLFLNLFYAGKLKAMPPKLISQDSRNTVIRPLAYCREKDIQAYSDWQDFPIIPCNLCGSQDGLQRQVIKDMLSGWDKTHSGRIETIFTALQNAEPSHLLDTEWHDFINMTANPSKDTANVQDKAAPNWLIPEKSD